MSLWNRVKTVANKAASEAMEQATIARLNLQLGEERTALRRKVAELGEAALELCRAGKLNQASVVPIYEAIQAQEAKVAEIEKQIADAHADGEAPDAATPSPETSSTKKAT